MKVGTKRSEKRNEEMKGKTKGFITHSILNIEAFLDKVMLTRNEYLCVTINQTCTTKTSDVKNQ